MLEYFQLPPSKVSPGKNKAAITFKTLVIHAAKANTVNIFFFKMKLRKFLIAPVSSRPGRKKQSLVILNWNIYTEFQEKCPYTRDFFTFV